MTADATRDLTIAGRTPMMTLGSVFSSTCGYVQPGQTLYDVRVIAKYIPRIGQSHANDASPRTPRRRVSLASSASLCRAVCV